MMQLFFLVSPIFLVVVLGKTAQHLFIKDLNVWSGLNKLTYWLLFPSLLFYKTSTIDFSSVELPNFSVSLLLGFAAAVLCAFLLGKLRDESNATITSMMQGAGRHNTFIALAVVDQLFGSVGTAIGIIATAILVPFSNIVMVIFMSVLHRENRGNYITLVSDVLKNPIILSIALGMAVNYSGWSRDPIFYELAGILGKAALPVLLLCIGAGLQFRGLRNQLTLCIISSFSKMIIFPLITYLAAIYLGLSETITIIAVIFAIAPTSPAGYSLAKQMGGNAPLIASIISLQTALSVLVIPLAVLFVQS
jgi:predicted permease